MQESFPIYESAEEATAAAIGSSGKTFKAVAMELWPAPARKPATAYARLKKCLNEDGDEHLTADEHMAIARITDQFHCLHYLCNEAGFERPRRMNREQQTADMQTQILGQMEQLRRKFDKLEALQNGR